MLFSRSFARYALLGAAILAALSPAVVDAGASSAYIEQVVSTGAVMGQPARSVTQRLWITANKFRVEDEGSGTTTILRRDTNKVWIVNAKQKNYMEMPFEQMKAMAEMGASMMGGKGEVKTTVTPTDETAKVGAWSARKVIISMTGPMTSEMVLWLSKDVDMDLRTWASLAEAMGVRGLVGDAVDQMSKLEGYPVKQESVVTMMGMKITTATEVKKFEAGAVDDAKFELPAGLKKMDGFPAMAGAGAGK